MAGMSTPALAPRSPVLGIAIVWITAALMSAAIGVFVVPADRAGWLAIGLGACVILAFGVQIAVGRAQGFIIRLAASVVGALAIMGIISLVFWIVTIVSTPIA